MSAKDDIQVRWRWGRPGSLCEATLDRRQRERELDAVPLPVLLLSTGAMSGPHHRPPATPIRLAHRITDFAQTYALYRRGGNTRRYSARIAYGCAFLDLPF